MPQVSLLQNMNAMLAGGSISGADVKPFDGIGKREQNREDDGKIAASTSDLDLPSIEEKPATQRRSLRKIQIA